MVTPLFHDHQAINDSIQASWKHSELLRLELARALSLHPSGEKRGELLADPLVSTGVVGGHGGEVEGAGEGELRGWAGRKKGRQDASRISDDEGSRRTSDREETWRKRREGKAGEVKGKPELTGYPSSV